MKLLKEISFPFCCQSQWFIFITWAWLHMHVTVRPKYWYSRWGSVFKKGHLFKGWGNCLAVQWLVGEGNGTPLQYSCLENPMDGGAWWPTVHGVAKSWTGLSDFTFTFHFHALEKEMATHSSVLAWRIPGTGEPGGLLSMGSRRVGHDWSDLAAVAAASGCYSVHSPLFRGTKIPQAIQCGKKKKRMR